MHPPSGRPFSRVHFSILLVLDPPRVLLRGGILLARDARQRRAGCELARVEGCPREGKRATSDGTSTAFPLPPLPPDHVIRLVSPNAFLLLSPKTLFPKLPPESKTRLGSLRYHSRVVEFILLSSFVLCFSRDAAVSFSSLRSRSLESVRSLSSILRFALSRLIHWSLLSFFLSPRRGRLKSSLDYGDFIGSRRWNDGSDAAGRSVDAR